MGLKRRNKIFCITRSTGGTTLNPKEFLLDEQNEVLLFETEQQANAYLLDNGIIDIKDSGIYIDEYVE